MLIVIGWDASYCCFYSSIFDFHPLKEEFTKEIMYAIQCKAYKQCSID